MIRFIFVLIIFIISSYSCNAHPVYEQESYIQDGENESFFIKKYGAPSRIVINPRYKFVGEYHVAIENTYPSTKAEFRDIPIKEIFWHFNEKLNLTCWFHYKDGEWKVIAYLFWPPGAKF